MLGFFSHLISDLKLEIMNGGIQFMFSGRFLYKVLVGEISFRSHSGALLRGKKKKKSR